MDGGSLVTGPTGLDTLLTNTITGIKYKLSIIGLEDNTFRWVGSKRNQSTIVYDLVFPWC